MRRTGSDGNLAAMTTTDTIDMTPSPAAPPPIRRLRRSRTDRIGAGVAGGLGEYFRVDPVLFRVLFATAAFFGGAGVLGYLLAWAAIPDAGTERAAIDGWVTSLRRRRIPFWLVVVAASVLFWIVAFSWWAPGPFFPVIAVVIVLVAIFGRRARRGPDDADRSVSLQKDVPADTADGRPEWVRETRRWVSESRASSRERRRRAFPVRIAVLVTLAVTIAGLGIADAASGIRLPVYFWCAFGVVGLGLLVGMVLRRTPWSMVSLLIPAVAGMIAFGNSPASLHDGVGQPDWTPTTVGQLKPDYRLAFGQGTLDLRNIGKVTSPRDIDVTMGAGQMKILLPKTLDATVHANVRIGVITVDGTEVADTHGGGFHRTRGYDIGHTVVPPSGVTGAPVTITVHLADGNIDVDRR